MATVVRREIRKRGFFGWVFLLLFLAFNVLMVLWLISYLAQVGRLLPGLTGAERTGAEIGTALGVGTILFVWAAGSVITGFLALLTRGRKTIVEEIQTGAGAPEQNAAVSREEARRAAMRDFKSR